MKDFNDLLPLVRFRRRVKREDVMATQSSAILTILVNHCGSLLTPDNVDKIHTEIIEEMREGPTAWAFSFNK